MLTKTNYFVQYVIRTAVKNIKAVINIKSLENLNSDIRPNNSRKSIITMYKLNKMSSFQSVQNKIMFIL